MAAKLSLSDSLGLWAPRGFDPYDPVWAKGGGLGRDRRWDQSRTRSTSGLFSLEWSSDYDDRVLAKACRSRWWAMLRPAVTLVIGGLALSAVPPSERTAVALLCAWLICPPVVAFVELERARRWFDAGRTLSEAQLTRIAYLFERNRNPNAAAAVRRRQLPHSPPTQIAEPRP